MNQTDVTAATQSAPRATSRSVARDIAAAARQMSGEIDRDRRLPEELVALLRDSGLLRAGMPREVRRSGAGARTGAAVRGRGGARRRVGRLVRIDRDHQQPAGRVPSAVQPRRAVRRRARCRRGGVGAARHGAVGARRRRGVGTLAVLQRDLARRRDVRRLPHRRAARAVGRSHCAKTTSRSSTPGTRWACAAPAATTRVADEVFVPADRVLSLFDGPIVDRPLYRFPVFGFFALSIARGRVGQCARRDRRPRRAGRRQEGAGVDRAPWPNVPPRRRRSRRPRRR